MTSALTMSAIDHTAFPHIVDGVFERADHAGLLALRSVSRAFRDRADARMGAHLVCNWTTVDSGLGRLPAYARVHAATRTASVASSTPYAALRRDAHVVDFGDMYTPRSMSLLPRADTARIWLTTFMHNPSVTLPAETLVVFGWPKQPQREPPASAAPVSRRGNSKAATRNYATSGLYEPPIALRPGTRKVVYHVSTRYSAHPQLLHQLTRRGPDVTELVLVLSTSDPPPSTWESAGLLNFLRCVGDVSQPRPDISITVVNAHDLPPHLKQAVLDAAEHTTPQELDTCNSGPGDCPLNHVTVHKQPPWTFVSLDEYRMRVGLRQFDIEMGL